MNGISRQFRNLEGRRVSVALADGSRLDDYQLVSVGRHGVKTLWLCTGSVDIFVPHPDVVDLWERAAA